MIEIQVDKNTPKRVNGGSKNMKKRQSNTKKLAGRKSRHPNQSAKIYYKKTPREKAAKMLAAQDLAQQRKIINSFNLPDWVDCDALRDIYRKDPIMFTE